ncbi:uncharacterized protein LOC119770519 isoform X2 [Culex quinquefasciatus]|uniref:uncharacterized protein LOC119769933 isoform X2 n=1 Tax=Culex quinquefasciatus TaxID=7176 RepID=UPI0018E38A42|nr:uncharacterized protein LOC119769933 isoform X2 [Culex quinquefasciatus]XP_038121461.1 uncharacterized protein LOC119770519 isoform X2 [Culex quinquefasciatus]
MARFSIYAEKHLRSTYNNCYRVVVLEKTVPSKNLLKVRLIVWQRGLPRIRIRIKNAAEIDCRELVQIVQPPAFLLGMLGEADDKFDEVGIIPIISSRTDQCRGEIGDLDKSIVRITFVHTQPAGLLDDKQNPRPGFDCR